MRSFSRTAAAAKDDHANIRRKKISFIHGTIMNDEILVQIEVRLY
jgi:hypothetical protein